ncbi:MAG: vanadium-dependent haloperoxidase [Chitinophagaceae bacterium]
MTQFLKFITISILAGLTFLTSCRKDAKEITIPNEPEQGEQPFGPGFADNDMVLYWNEKAAIVLGAPMNQPTRTRYFAMISIAVHDALNCVKPKYQRYALFNLRRQSASPESAVASAAYWTIKGLSLQGNFPVDAWYNESLALIPDEDSKELGKSLGKEAAEAIINKRANDGFAKVLPASSTPLDGDDPGEYRSTLMYVNGVPTPTTIKRVSNWGTVLKPFVIESNQQFRPAGPYPVNSDEYAADYNEVKTKGARVNGNRSIDEESIARFWSENRPSLTWNNFTRKAIGNKKLDAWKTARLFALVHVSLADGINAQLNAGYHFYFWRPETGIRLADSDGNNNTEADPNWLPFLDEVPGTFPTPPVPGYPNAFAVYGGATAEILRLFLDSDKTSIELSSLTLPGKTRQFFSFSQAAKENALSMIYAGWDFRKSALAGEEMGRQIAGYVFTHHFQEQ